LTNDMSTGTGDLATLRLDEPVARQRAVGAVPSRVSRMAVVLTLVAIALGLLLRLWYLFHVPTNSDEAIVAFMANDALHGHFYAFYWGQSYGGGESYVVALLFALFGHSTFVLGLTGVVLSAVAAILTWRAATRLVRSRQLAMLTGALVWVVPDAAIANSTREYGFRGVTLTCGLACLVLALRLLDASPSWLDACALGLFAGIGWWSSPEIVYFLLPAGLLVAGAMVGGPLPWRHWVPKLAAAAGTFVVGALPWLWANAHSGFASLKPSSFPNGAITSLNTGFWGRLSIFARLSLPIELDLRHLQSGTFLFGGSGAGLRHALGVGTTIVVIALAVVVVLLCAARGGRWLALGATVLVFPFLFAAQPGTWFWEDGRYIVFLGPLLALTVAAGLEEGGRRLSAGGSRARGAPASAAVLAMSLVLVAGMVLSVFALAGDNATSVGTLASGWGNPNAPVARAVATLRSNGVRAGFADYWVAYKLDLLGGPALTITTAPGDVDRQKSFDTTVDAAPEQAWIFVPPAELPIGLSQFSGASTIAGPDGISEADFVAALRALQVPYRSVDAGLLAAVIPDRKVTLRQVEAAGA
jgi:Dolichyl-phosphate-mannose-protein mannosyltransferase